MFWNLTRFWNMFGLKCIEEISRLPNTECKSFASTNFYFQSFIKLSQNKTDLHRLIITHQLRTTSHLAIQTQIAWNNFKWFTDRIPSIQIFRLLKITSADYITNTQLLTHPFLDSKHIHSFNSTQFNLISTKKHEREGRGNFAVFTAPCTLFCFPPKSSF